MASAGFEPAVLEIERPEIYALNRVATEIGKKKKKKRKRKRKRKKEEERKKKKKKTENTATANVH